MDAVEWSCDALSLDPAHLGNVRNAQWETSYLFADSGGTTVGLLSLHRSRSEHFPVEMFDPAAVAPAVFGAWRRPASDYLFLGGGTDLVAGCALARHLPEAERARVGRALADAAFATAERRGLCPAAMYVPDGQAALFRAGHRPGVVVEHLAELPVPGPDLDSYLAFLDSGRRSVVSRDLNRLERAGLHGRPGPAADAAAEGAPLVAAVKRRHGIAEHPRLTALRLSRWATVPVGWRLAFEVRDRHGRLAAVSFGCHDGDVLELFEIGLDDGADRHLAYVEALVYAPMRYAIAERCRVIRLGLGSSRPKDLRGARFIPMWAIGEEMRK
ncbi:GNAT family N-acetyltransferase [Paractinoplanes rishiriensis]|uniref:GNAT family N-acetyltransferase n=1 Tax=Paractinoplanes rishiriensis TaxID=1050105 RepID=UPI00194225DB|nr:GNAT family N-acetyltransferase [Actinoplanes rishiriensis]